MGWWSQCFDSTRSESAFRKESPVFLIPLANLSVHSTYLSDILTFDASLQQKNTNIEKKNKHVFVGVLYVFCFFKNGTHLHSTNPPFLFVKKFGAWRSLLPYAAVGLEFSGWNGPQLHSCTDVARCQRSERWDPHGFGGKNPWEQKYMLEIYTKGIYIYIYIW